MITLPSFKGSIAPVISSVAYIGDNFDAASLNTTFWALSYDDGVTGFAQQNGNWEYTPEVNSGGAHYRTYLTQNSYDFTDRSMTLSIAQYFTYPSNGYFDFYLLLANGDKFYYLGSPSSGSTQTWSNMGGSSSHGTGANIAAEKLRIRHSSAANKIYYESYTAADGWIAVDNRDYTASVASCKFRISVGVNASTDAGTLKFSDFTTNIPA